MKVQHREWLIDLAPDAMFAFCVDLRLSHDVVFRPAWMGL